MVTWRVDVRPPGDMLNCEATHNAETAGVAVVVSNRCEAPHDVETLYVTLVTKRSQMQREARKSKSYTLPEDVCEFE